MNKSKFKGRVDYLLGKFIDRPADKDTAVTATMDAFNDLFPDTGCPECGDMDIYDTEHIHMGLDRVEKYIQCGNGHWYEIMYRATSKRAKPVDPD